MFQIEYSPKASKNLEKIPRKHQDRILRAVDNLSTDPFLGKKLEGHYTGLYSLRVWPYRIIYAIEKKKLIIYVVTIGHRQSIYNH